MTHASPDTTAGKTLSLIDSKLAMGWMHTARFFTTAAQLNQLPKVDVPEIAFVGRSNAGKSTAINTLTQQKQLAFASKKPGRTQHINLFALGKQGVTDAVLADLPGYGYAAVSRTDKERWQRVMLNYLMSRESLSAVVLLCDPRLGLTELDEALLDAIRPRVEQGLKFLIVLTKADKLTRAEQAKILSITKLNAGGGEVRLFSALKKQGVDDVAQLLWHWCHPEAPGRFAPGGNAPGCSRHPSDARRRDTCAKSAIGAYLASARSYKRRASWSRLACIPCPQGLNWNAAPAASRVSPCCCFCTAFPKAPSSGMGCLSNSAAATAAWRPICAAMAAPASPRPSATTAPNTWWRILPP
jgi:GTP-binding protein